MAKKRGLAANRGLDALLGSIKKEKQITASALQDDMAARAANAENDDANDDTASDNTARKGKSATTPTSDNVTSSKAAAPKSIAANQDAVVDTDANNDIEPAKRSARTTRNPVKTRNNKPRSNEQDNTATEDQISLVQIDVGRLQAGKYQPRRDMSETALAELAASIEQHGVMQPIVIRPLLANEDKSTDEVTHEIIAGERRWRAAKMANKTVIPAIERALSDELAIALALIENIQREDLSVIEQAAALQRFHTEFGMSHAMIAEVVGEGAYHSVQLTTAQSASRYGQRPPFKWRA